MCYHYTIHRNVQTYAAGFEPASLFLPEEKLSKNCCKFPYFSYVLFVTTPSLELGNLPSTYDGVCLRFTPRWWWIEQLEACQWRLSLFSLLLIFFLNLRHLFPRWYSHRFIRILTVTLSVTHINVLTITTCLGVPTTLYPHLLSPHFYTGLGPIEGFAPLRWRQPTNDLLPTAFTLWPYKSQFVSVNYSVYSPLRYRCAILP